MCADWQTASQLTVLLRLAPVGWRFAAAVRMPPTGGYLLPECVPKYVVDLLLPPVMPANTAPTNKVSVNASKQLLQQSTVHLSAQ
jgi:hypothetical protein